ncbi:MAG: GAF domain-containing protein [Armatimonadetes bacterium]|nr:GAF domain-containing protein [Armatimonadota bacterium]
MSENSMPSETNEYREQLDAAQARIHELEARLHEVEDRAPKKTGEPAPASSEEGGLGSTPLSEADATLKRLVQRIAMILQAEKIVIMFYNRETGELHGIPPAYGVEEDQLKIFRSRATHGVAGLVFRDSKPVIFHDATTDPRTKDDPFSLLHVNNGITVPLVIERRDEENRVVERTPIGVLHAFNKRHGESFIEEDVRLLERMARNVGSIIANLQLYREVVEEREELLQTFESLTAGLVLISPEGLVSQMNATARTIFQAPEIVVGKPYGDIINFEGFGGVIDATLKSEEPPRQEISVSIAGVERVYQIQAARVRSDEGKDLGVVAILSDITEVKNVERMKSSFVAMASHELRTPLTAIKGFVSTLLMDETFTLDERREFYMIIDQECDRLTRLINDLLNTARIESNQSLKPNYTQVEINKLLDKAVRIQRQAAPKHRLTLEADQSIRFVTADEDKFDQVITNLLSNAIKYSPNGGTIRVKSEKQGNDLLISVQDHGMGIPKDHLNKVFDQFHRVHNEDNRKIYGTGLGLFLVKHLVESVHLGKIWAESEVGVGSTFYVRIPMDLDIDKAKAAND